MRSSFPFTSPGVFTKYAFVSPTFREYLFTYLCQMYRTHTFNHVGPPKDILRMYAVRGWFGQALNCLLTDRLQQFSRLVGRQNPPSRTHVERVKSHLETGRNILEHLGHATYDIEGVEPNPELSTLSPPLPNERFYVSTDERDPDAMEVIRQEGGVFLSDLLTMKDWRKYS